MHVLISGISGQTGSYLAELALERGHAVSGIIRRHSTAESQDCRLVHLGPLDLHYGDVTDAASVRRIVSATRPDFIFNMAAMSHVRVSFDVPHYTAQVNAVGALNMLEAWRELCPEARYYQASSSELWGSRVDPDGMQRETTPMTPVSPYGIAKLFAFHMTAHFRRAFGLFATNGILHNHESPRRGTNFVTAKVVKTAVRISKGLESELVLGNIDSKRDWGHARDYARAIWMMMEYREPDDYVVATGQTRSVRDLCEYVFSRLGMDYRRYVRQDAQYMRAEELPYLRGDASKARVLLGWEPTYTFESMIDEMIEHWQEAIGGTRHVTD